MKTCARTIGFSLAFLLLCSITDAAAGEAPLPGPDAKDLWQYISKTLPYTQWQTWEETAGIQPANPPHGPLRRIYVNEPALHAAKPAFPEGAIIIKENLSTKEELTSLSVMYKVKGFNPSGRDWFWVRYSPAGKVEAVGKPRGCVGCHSSRAFNDYVFVHKLP